MSVLASVTKQERVAEVLNQHIVRSQAECRRLTRELQRVREESMDAMLPSLANNCRQRLSGRRLNSHRVLKGHFDQVADVAWFPDNRRLVSASQDGFLLVWDAVSGMKTGLVELDDPWVTCIGGSSDGRLVAVGGLENACVVYKVGSDTLGGSSLLSIFKGHGEYISGLSFLSGSSSQVVTCSGDKSSILWDTTKGGQVSKYHGHLGDVLALDVRPGDPHGFVTCSCDRVALLWDTRQKRASRRYAACRNCDCSAVRFFPDGHSFAVGGDDGLVKLFDLRSDGQIAEYKMEEAGIEAPAPAATPATALAPAPAAALAATPAPTASSSSEYGSIQGSIDQPGVLALEFSTSGRLMFASYGDYPGVVVWDTVTGEVLGTLDGHRGAVEQVRVSRDGLAVATASRDGTVRVWTPFL